MRNILKAVIGPPLLLLLVTATASKADIKLPAIFSDHMILQQNTQVKLWGTADAGENITIVASWGEEKSVTADGKGNWKTEIQTPAGSHVPQQIIFKGNNNVFLGNVLIGEVWLCSGQSNMAWSIKRSHNSYEETKNANYPSIRFFHIPRKLAWKPQNDVNAHWQPCSPESISDQSALAYFFGRELRQELDVPIGLIVSAWGGSGAQAWIDKETAGKEGLQDIVDWYNTNESKLQQYRYDFVKASAEWRSKQPEGAPIDWSTRPKRNLPGDQHMPFALYNGMIHPIKTYSMKGAIWYQGESNVSRAHQYRTLFPAMIKSWRNVWNQGNFPFYYVQIAPFHYSDYEGITSAELRDAQLKTLDVTENTGMVVITDIGDVNDIHPTKKQEVGRRLALLALHNDYKKIEGAYSSPFYKSHRVEGSKIIVSLDHAKALKARGKDLIGFTIAGKNKVFVKADAKIINGNQLEISSKQVRRPVAVRFGWSNALVTNLFNEINLPVSPFKTDNWKDTTEGKIHLDFP
ncbi:sialate O-acetylesterase [Fulvivirgaceae bacterium BMA12]|uniref:Sialate O-acetylesterase n=1 Tax=Agaribacillus aureus TaxID=3051825 RepID=A0ABT8LGF5_9BACT|nr:sialate O-acetylesterase [Fulvivirgaceae bacterium BMA12]